MADTKISAATAVVTPATSIELPCNDGGSSKKITVAQILEALAATQADMEAGTSTTTAVTPAVLHFHPGVAKCWLKCGAAGNVIASYNITSVADTGTGIATVTIGTDFSSADWCCQTTGLGTGATAANMRVVSPYTQAAGSVILGAFNLAATPGVADPSAYFMVGYGDH